MDTSLNRRMFAHIFVLNAISLNIFSFCLQKKKKKRKENTKFTLYVLLDKARKHEIHKKQRQVPEVAAAIAERTQVFNLGVECEFKFSPFLPGLFLILLSSMIFFLTLLRKNSHCYCPASSGE